MNSVIIKGNLQPLEREPRKIPSLSSPTTTRHQEGSSGYAALVIDASIARNADASLASQASKSLLRRRRW
jgi:hypothetical protein